MTVHARIRAMKVAITAFITTLWSFTTATLLTLVHHGVLVSSLTFRMSKTMIVRTSSVRVEQGEQSSLRGFLNLEFLEPFQRWRLLYLRWEHVERRTSLHSNKYKPSTDSLWEAFDENEVLN